MDHATKVASLATLQAALIKYYEMVAQVKATATAIDAAIYEVHANAASCRVELARLEAEARAVEGADHAEIDRRAAELFSQVRVPRSSYSSGVTWDHPGQYLRDLRRLTPRRLVKSPPSRPRPSSPTRLWNRRFRLVKQRRLQRMQRQSSLRLRPQMPQAQKGLRTLLLRLSVA